MLAQALNGRATKAILKEMLKYEKFPRRIVTTKLGEAAAAYKETLAEPPTYTNSPSKPSV